MERKKRFQCTYFRHYHRSNLDDNHEICRWKYNYHCRSRTAVVLLDTCQVSETIYLKQTFYQFKLETSNYKYTHQSCSELAQLKKVTVVILARLVTILTIVALATICEKAQDEKCTYHLFEYLLSCQTCHAKELE